MLARCGVLPSWRVSGLGASMLACRLLVLVVVDGVGVDNYCCVSS